MKIKQYVILILGFCLALNLTGCNKGSSETLQAEDSLYISESQEGNSLEGSYVYENVEMGFSLEMPRTWEGKFFTEKTQEGVSFYHKNKKEGLHAELFSIYIFGTEGDWENASPEFKEYHALELGVREGMVYVRVRPSDFQYNPEEEEESVIREYESMLVESNLIFDSFRFINEKNPSVEQSDPSKVVLEEEFVTEDGLTYTLVLNRSDIESEYYDNIRIYKEYTSKKECVFDLQSQDFNILGVKLDEVPAFYTYEDQNKDGIKELYFTESGLLSDYPRRLIIGYFNETFEIMFFRPIYKIEYQDFDGDGSMELFGETIPGQVSYDMGFEEVFRLQNNKYYHAAVATKEFADLMQEEALKRFNKERSIKNLNYLIGRYAYSNDLESIDRLLLENEQMMAPYIENPDYYEDVMYISNIFSMIEMYEERWQWNHDNDESLAVSE